MLKSVVVHFGESSSSGHYISYTCDKYGEMVYNDSDVHRVLWNSIKENISTGGCLFFYINKECSGINSKDASTVKVVRRRRKVRQPVQPVPSSESIVYEEVELLYAKSGEFPEEIMLSELDCKLQKLFVGLVLKIKTILNTPFSQAVLKEDCFRHCLFVVKRRQELKQHNKQFVLDQRCVTEEQCTNIWRFVRHALTEKKMQIKHTMDGFVFNKRQIGLFLKRSIAQSCEHCEVSIEDTAEYFGEVAYLEAVTFFIMEQEKMSYSEASILLNVSPTTYNDYFRCDNRC